MIDPLLAVQITISVLLFISESLPFITSNDYQGLLHMLVLKLERLSAPMVQEDQPRSPVLELEEVPRA